MKKERLFSVTPKDLRVDTFRSGGKGGQNQNKVNSGVRVTHLASGAVGEARDNRDQLQNKKNAFRRMTESPRFKIWLRLEIAAAMGQESPEAIVDRQMEEKNLRVEVRGQGTSGWVRE